MNISRLVIAGTHSGVGKTTVTLGLMATLQKRGLNVQPFKVGPDYIDPGFHNAVTGRCSHNLDSWLTCPEDLPNIVTKYGRDAHVVIVEGVMGLYDGLRNQGEMASTAQVSKILNAPVVLIVSGAGMARSVAAVVKGYVDFDPSVNIIGVIVNQAGSENHGEILCQAIRDEVGVPVLGVMGRQGEISLPSRHLGLVPAGELNDLPQILNQLVAMIEKNVDVDKLLFFAGQAPPLEHNVVPNTNSTLDITLGIAMDEAFNFYYHDSLNYLQELGAKPIYFSPLKDKSLPEVDGIYIGGGFPEVFLPRLSANKNLMNIIKQQVLKGVPIYGECGGFMYLCDQITDFNGNGYPMTGLIPGKVQMQKRLSALGYVSAEMQSDTIMGSKGNMVRGHEFHYSTVSDLPEEYAAFSLRGGRGAEGRYDGYAKDNIFGSYIHIHFRGNPKLAHNFVSACSNYKLTRCH